LENMLPRFFLSINERDIKGTSKFMARISTRTREPQ
jgi:hypothetical protein